MFLRLRSVSATLASLAGALGWLAFAASPRLSHAQTGASDAGVHLSWTRSSDAMAACPDAGRVQSDVVRRLRRSPFSEPSRVFVEASVSRIGALWRAEIEMRDADGSSLGSRRVESDSATCTSLASAAGLAIALMIDPDALVERAPEVSEAAPPRAEPDRAPMAAPVEPATTRRQRRLAVVASLLGVSRALPEPALGARLATELALVDGLDVALSLAVVHDRREIRNGEDVSFGLVWGGVGPCYRLIDSVTVKLSGCASLLFGALRSVVFDPSRARTAQLPWAAGALGVRAGFSPLPPFQLEGGLDLMTPFYRRDYLVERAPGDQVSVFSDPALAGAAFLGVGVRY